MRILDYACDAAMDQGSEEPLNVWAAIEVRGRRSAPCQLHTHGLLMSSPTAHVPHVACQSKRNVRLLQAAVLRFSHCREHSRWRCTVAVIIARQAAAPGRLVSGEGTEAARASARSRKHPARLSCSVQTAFSMRAMLRARYIGQVMHNTARGLASCYSSPFP